MGGEAKRRKEKYPALYGTLACPGAGKRASKYGIKRNFQAVLMSDGSVKTSQIDRGRREPWDVGRNEAKRERRAPVVVPSEVFDRLGGGK